MRDIPGTAVGSTRVGAFQNRQRSQFRETNNIAEVPGAQPGTLKKGLVSNRVTNPLNPTYTLPGATVLGAKA